MKFGYSTTCLEHDTGPRHPETADRIRAIRTQLQTAHGATFADPPPADRMTIEQVHDQAYVAEIREFSADGGGSWDADTVMSDGSWDAALASAGLAVWAAKNAIIPRDGSDIPFALGRPPGHHAVRDDAMGFCLFNNAAVAAQSLLESREATTVAIVDWDVHHGNGTQAIFLDRADVPYASIHEAGIYPGTGKIQEIGVDDGQGATMNIPLTAGAGTPAFVEAVEAALDPWLALWEPDVIIVSAGFDAHRHDPISRLNVTTEGFGMLTDRLRTIANREDAGLAFVLEGGYGLDTLSAGVEMVHQVCHGYEPVESDDDPRPADLGQIRAVRDAHGLGL